MFSKHYPYLNTMFFLGIVLFFSSCFSTAKIISGFKNPKIETFESVVSAIDDYDLDDNHVFDLLFLEPKDSIELNQILISSMSGENPIFDKRGIRKCYTGTSKCSMPQDLISGFEDKIGDCKVNEVHGLQYKNLDTLLLNTINYYGDTLKLEDLHEYDYYIFFYWSKFISSEKRLKEDYNTFVNDLNNINKNILVLRLNCDLREDWGLKKGRKIKIKMKKNVKNIYRLEIGELPYLKSSE